VREKREAGDEGWKERKRKKERKKEEK